MSLPYANLNESSPQPVDPEEVSRRLETFRSAVKSAGMKLTNQRLAIFEAVASYTDHPRAEVVHKRVSDILPHVSLDTVYRTLWTLTDLGLLSTLGPRNDPLRFDANTSHHHHYRCNMCGDVRDLRPDQIPKPVDRPTALPEVGQVESLHIELRGTCDACGKRAEKPVPA